jgi:UDP-glucose 4-epimerase
MTSALYHCVISTPLGRRRQGILGTAVRDYIHVDDLAAAHVLALEALEQGSPHGGL